MAFLFLALNVGAACFNICTKKYYLLPINIVGAGAMVFVLLND